MKARDQILRRRIRILTWLFIVGLVISGVTAIPLRQELGWLVHVGGWDQTARAALPASGMAFWLLTIRDALDHASPFLFYGTDWLAFGHFVIAIAFIGALRDPVRNRWLFDFGLIACVLVIPFAFIFGEIRGIPLWWRLIDCSFGVCGFVPLYLCRKWAIALESAKS